jgi:hypothetical protein
MTRECVMSRHASRRPDSIQAGKLTPPAPASEPVPRPEGVETPPGPSRRSDRIWILVLWLWAAAFVLLLLSEVVMFCLRRLS